MTRSAHLSSRKQKEEKTAPHEGEERGDDADLVIVDPTSERSDSQTAGSRSDYCLHQGKILKGWARRCDQVRQWLTPQSIERARGLVGAGI